MALRASAKFVRGSARVRFIPHCGDGTLPSATGGVFGGVGPYDFTAAHAVIAAVPIKIKIDAATEISDTIDLTTSAEAAVTATELVDAITAATITGLTAAVDATTGRPKLTSAGTYLQVYGLAAELAGFGMGIGAQIVKGDTFESITVVPTKKDDTTVAISDARQKETSVIIPGYVKGATGVLSDTVVDYYLKRIFEGGVIDSSGKYNWPISTTIKPVFMIEIYDQVYSKGENFEQNLVGYKKITIKSCTGSTGDQSHASDFQKPSYNYVAVNYQDSAGVEASAVIEEDLTVAAFNALNFDSV